MPRFFSDDIRGNEIILSGDDAHHITRSLRMRAGEPVTVCDGRGTDYHCEVEKTGEIVRLKLLFKEPSQSEPDIYLRLFMAIPKGDKMEFVIQKAVELGAGEVIPVLTERCVARPDPKRMHKKTERYQKISQAAAKQCGRGIIPEIQPLCTFNEAVHMAREDDISFLFYENGGEHLSSFCYDELHKISLFVGSEGGFSEQEVLLAKENGVKIATLGKRVLRCETAPLAAISLLMFCTKNI